MIVEDKNSINVFYLAINILQSLWCNDIVLYSCVIDSSMNKYEKRYRIISSELETIYELF